MRNYVLSQINSSSAGFAVTNVTETDSLTLSGTGPLKMVSLEINGAAVDVDWVTAKTWTASYDFTIRTVRHPPGFGVR